MENKCLVIKLNNSVNNDSLRIFGKARIKASSVTGNVSMWITYDKDSVVEIKSPTGEVLLTKNCEANVRYDVGIDASPYEYVTYVIECYNIINLYGHNNPQYGAAEDANYSLYLEEINYSKIAEIAVIELYKKKESVIVLPNILTLNIGTFCNNLTELESFATLTSINRKPHTDLLPLSGKWETLIEKWIESGRNSGSCAVNNFAGICTATFNGISTEYVTFTIEFTDTGCSVTPGINFITHNKCNGATYDKNTNQWTYLPIEDEA